MKILGAIVKNFAIAFFFFCLITTLGYLVSFKKISPYIRLFNNFLNSPINNKENEVTFDKETKEITHYPNYGDKFGTINMPTIGVSVPLYHGDSMDILKKGAGHYSGSFFPSEGGTILIAAHNRQEYFKYLPKLNINDEIIINTVYGNFYYQVLSGKVMKVNELEKIEFQQEKELLVLYTCYPVDALGYTNERYVIYGTLERVDYEN